MSRANKNLLLVEGKDDKHVFGHLFSHYGIAEGVIAIKDKDEFEHLLNDLPVELRASELERLGVVVDADTNITGQWQSLSHVLTKAGYAIPSPAPIPEGAIIRQENLPVVGVWLMPNNQLPGILEDFVGFLVPKDDSRWNKASECVNSIPQEQRRFSAAKQPKAYIHTWLAWQEEPGTPLGSAITKRYLDADAPHAQQLMEWVRRLFDIG